jgi:hypothetical protein
MIDFDVEMAGPLGVSSGAAVRRGDVPLPLLRHSVLSVLGERPEWMVSCHSSMLVIRGVVLVCLKGAARWLVDSGRRVEGRGCCRDSVGLTKAD